MPIDLTYEPWVSLQNKMGPTATRRAKRRRAEARVAKHVRALCVERDGYCRLMGLSPCDGPSEWAHLGEKKRARTRGMSPEMRHTTSGSLMACSKHHRAYDAGKIGIAVSETGADGPIRAEEGIAVVMC